LLYRRGLPPQATYIFKHALIRDAAYASLLKRTRQQYHQQIAQVLEACFPATQESQPELLAHHYTEAGCTKQAISYWQQAGEQAIQRSANVEAIAHLRKGLELLTTLPDTIERAQHELTLQLALGVPLQATKGYAARERGEVYTRAWELCQQLGETSQRFPVLFGLWQFYNMGGELQTSREVAEQLLSLARHQDDPALLLEVHRALGLTLLNLGELVPARELVEQGIALYDPQQHRAHAFLYGQDPGMTCRVYTALVLWLLGYADQARARSHEAITLARELAHPYSLAMALGWAARLHLCCRDVQGVTEHAEALMTLSTEQGFPTWMAHVRVLRGWALATQERGEEGIAQMRQGMAAFRAIGAVLWATYDFALLAEAYKNVGHVKAGLDVLAEALTLVDKTGYRYWEAELYRLKGELLQGQAIPDAHQAETCFHQALDVSRHQHAKSLELRAATSLARLWQAQDKRQDAYDLLAPVYGWFTEGFETADLKDARALLEELGG
jgi:predicted ATPase